MVRAMKNRFGATDEIGVFEMTGLGLTEVANPSALFLAGRDASAPGAAVLAGMEGTRPLLVEIQALVAPSPLGMPRRAVVGWDANRLSMIVAVLEAHAGLRFGAHDIYLNVAGGLRIAEPAADLAAAAALVSSLTGAVLPARRCLFRRDRPFRGAAAGHPFRSAAEGSRQAWLSPSDHSGERARRLRERRAGDASLDLRPSLQHSRHKSPAPPRTMVFRGNRSGTWLDSATVGS